MFERSSEDGKKKFSHNSVLNSDKIKINYATSKISLHSVLNVSVLPLLNVISVFFDHFKNLYSHRDNALETERDLYDLKKQVFYYLDRASKNFEWSQSKLTITNLSIRNLKFLSNYFNFWAARCVMASSNTN